MKWLLILIFTLITCNHTVIITAIEPTPTIDTTISPIPKVKYHITINELQCHDPLCHDTMSFRVRYYGEHELIPRIEPLRIICNFFFTVTSGWRPKWLDEYNGRYYFSEHESLWACDIFVGDAGQIYIVEQYIPLYSGHYGLGPSWFHFGIGDIMQPDFFKKRHWFYDGFRG